MRKEVWQVRAVGGGLLIWFGSLVAYCIVQTLANRISVLVQDILLLAMPLMQAAVIVCALRTGPPLPLPLRIALGGLAAWAFGGLYQSYFKEVIVGTLHIWNRHEGNLQPMMAFIGFLVLVGVFGALIAAALFGARRRVQV